MASMKGDGLFVRDLVQKFPLIEDMKKGKEVFWLNPGLDNVLPREVSKADIEDASERLARFAPYIVRAFPETSPGGGSIESPLKNIPEMKAFLNGEAGGGLSGRLLLKCDSELPISGSIKARGGIYEVLCFAEKVALESGLLNRSDDYAVLAEDRFRELFSRYAVSVGSTGNLGLSIGIMGARLGFRLTVHMSADARQWKKDLLRQKGAKVAEYRGDFQMAVAEGRRQAEGDPLCHFVDDENSRDLFLGYAAAAERLKRQLDGMGITVDSGHPLFVYLPCGVGGGPGGVTFGLKHVFGENVHCFFAEPVQSPCMLLGIMTGLHDGICVQDVGLSGRTSADGLAVGRPSKLVGRLVGNLLDGLFTVSDSRMEALVRDLYTREGIFVEPSAAAGFPGFAAVQRNGGYAERLTPSAMDHSVHIVWATGGSMVPEGERKKYLAG
ncbi:D-serine ammonia-lyase [Aminivibrio pyruvatiphilus]|uniref:Probable D-serine dehydratase n=2 Tax=Aminivibrio pyruvatiphilus TaxID=1005740 RepID=A0A4R8M1I5_9BACT|nr:D-serine ammonia-lyase [Aminivibrio pyruvatiphilus]